MPAYPISPSKLGKYFRLDRDLRRTLLEAFVQLAVARIGLSVRPFKAMVANMQMHREEPEGISGAPEFLTAARGVGWAVSTAAMHTPWHSGCLVQVLAAQRMLQRRGIPGMFCIGARKIRTGATDEQLLAHAWLKYGDTVITGESGHRQYRVVSCFSWSGEALAHDAGP